MSTLKEAIESGRRWGIRDKGDFFGWYGPGPDNCRVTVEQALSSDFEIESAKLEPRELWLHIDGRYYVDKQCSSCTRIHYADECDSIRSSTTGPTWADVEVQWTEVTKAWAKLGAVLKKWGKL